jgi:hypothetical protein
LPFFRTTSPFLSSVTFCPMKFTNRRLHHFNITPISNKQLNWIPPRWRWVNKEANRECALVATHRVCTTIRIFLLSLNLINKIVTNDSIQFRPLGRARLATHQGIDR